MEEKAFAVITKDSVQLMAENAGHSNISDEVAAILGEDVSYRLREVVMKSAECMKNAKRRRLYPEDFNQALRDLNEQPVYGQNVSTDSLPFRQTREGELHFVEDMDINFNNTVFNSYVPKSLGQASIKGQWMAVEGVNKLSSSSHSTTHKTPKREVSDEQMNYYNKITKAIMSSRIGMVKWALADLKKNVNVVPLLSYFVNFVTNGVKAVTHDVSKLSIFMRTAESLLRNQAFFLETQPYLNMVVHSVETCLLEPQAAYINQHSMDHWMLRDFSARLLAEIVRKWSSPVNRLRTTVVDKLSETLNDLKNPLCSHYGAIMGLLSLGSAEVETVLVNQLPELMSYIQTIMTDARPSKVHLKHDAVKILYAVQCAVEKILRTNLESLDLSKCSENSKPPVGKESTVHQGTQDIVRLYQQFHEYFGDVLSVKLPILELDKVFVKQPSLVTVSLGDKDSKRSGNELLSDLMQQVWCEQEEEQRRQLLQQQMFDSLKFASLTNHPLESSSSDISQLDFISGNSRFSHSSETLDLQACGFQEQLAVSSSTISDPSKGTLKLKIKRHTQGQGSPSLQMTKTWSEPDPQQQLRDMREKEYRQKRKRKQAGRNPFDQEGMEFGELSDLDDSYGHSLWSQSSQAYSPGAESSGSDSNHRKGKLMMKFKVPSKDSTSD